jgi:mannosyltransferase
MSASRKIRDWAVWFALAAIAALATWMRLHGIADKSFWTDEGVSAALAKLDWYNFGRILWRREANMALYYLLLRGWTLLDDSVAMIRGMSALWSIAMVPAIFLVARRLFGTAAGLCAAILWAVNAYAVRYAQEARSYSLVAFLVTLAIYFFIIAIDSGRKRDWTWYAVISVLGIYAHFFAALVLVAHGVVVCFALPQKKAEYLAAAKRIGLWTLPVWIFIATTGTGPIGWIPRPSLRGMVTVFGDYSGNGGTWLPWLYFVLGLITVAAAVRAGRGDWRYLLVVAWFVVPLAITLLVSIVRPVFIPRYLIVSIPGLVLMVATGITWFKRWWITVPLVAVICWFGVAGVRGYYQQDFEINREDTRSTTTYILQNAQPGDGIAFHKEQNRFAYSYYANHLADTRPAIVYPGADQPTWLDFMGKVTPAVLTTLSSQRGRVWLVISQNLSATGEDAPAQQMKTSLSSTHQLVEQKDFPYLRVYLYQPK